MEERVELDYPLLIDDIKKGGGGGGHYVRNKVI